MWPASIFRSLRSLFDLFPAEFYKHLAHNGAKISGRLSAHQAAKPHRIGIYENSNQER